jgi:hypothetical protein
MSKATPLYPNQDLRLTFIKHYGLKMAVDVIYQYERRGFNGKQRASAPTKDRLLRSSANLGGIVCVGECPISPGILGPLHATTEVNGEDRKRLIAGSTASMGGQDGETVRGEKGDSH